MDAKQHAYNQIAALVDKFGRQIDNYKSANYNETLTRRDFIDPFFEALGWDINNRQNLWEGYRQVIHEDKIKIGSSTKAPDYSFRLPGGQRLFFVEAKKPNVDIYKGYEPARQVRLYGWNAKLAISIVTDFEEFAVYDCSKKPGKNDKPSKGRIEYFTYKDYLNRFDFIWDTFSHTEVMKGGLVRYQQADKKGTATVDKDFLASLDEWRKQLALSIAKHNDIGEDELNFAVQQTIDRLIFLRFAEDRQLEPEFQLKSCLKDEDHYKELLRQFRVADDKYNSGLFHFRKEKENSAPHDTLTTGITVDNKTIKSIINGLYDNEYLFDIIPVEILGSAYEQFLGKRIVLKSPTRAEIEDKPEVRHADGVYYTPQYIVDYIVEHTVGKLCEGKTPAQVAKLKIVDPACGSGSFLLGAYDYLLKWHLKYYEKNADAISKKTPQVTPDGLLTTAEKKRILVNNIYGVDIDDNAVEVTKLSLLLKCMEGETKASVVTTMTMFHERVLPSLENNIKAGNSLVDYDYYEGELDFGEEKKVRPFSWQQAFPDVFKNGGFDVVIGNPPYVRQELLSTYKPYYQKKYKAYHGIADLYVYFIEKSFEILKPKGYYGIIVANKWMKVAYGRPLRDLLKRVEIKGIIDFGPLPVFRGATTYTCILIAENKKAGKYFEFVNVSTLLFDNLKAYIEDRKQTMNYSSLEDSGWNLVSERNHYLKNKIFEQGTPLKEYVNSSIYRGVLTGLNEAFVIDEATKQTLIAEDSTSADKIKPFLAGRDVKRYGQPVSDKYLILFEKGSTNKEGNNPQNALKWLKDNYPALAKHLLLFKEKAEKRTDQGDYWWELRACDYYPEFENKKIIWPGISSVVANFAYDTQKYYGNDNTHLIISDDKYLLGILNSRLSKYVLENICDKVQGGFYRLKISYVSTLPIIKINAKNKEQQQLHDTIVKHVDTMLQLNEELQATTVPARRSALEARIAHTDKEIDRLVYQLYGLTDEEIKIVEGV